MIGVDVGGTFTDVVSVRDGAIRVVKVATDPRDTHQSVLAGAQELDVGSAELFNHASTHGINAIITRRLPKIAFLTTLGHRDIPDMGRTWRPQEALTDPGWRRPFGDVTAPLVPRYLRRGIRERITATGDVLIALDEAQARHELGVLKRCEVQGVAICLLSAYVDARHEQRLRELVASELGGDMPCSISSDVSPLAKEYARASTTIVDVFMKLIYVGYTERLAAGLAQEGFTGDLNLADCMARLMPSDVAMRAPYRVVFAGPAAGTVSSAYFAEELGARNLLCADVGGTSCDISAVVDGAPFVNTTFELEPELLVNALSTEIASIGAGGGSIVAVGASGELTVGPGSAGADPGPACYGRGGTLPTITDACLLIGIIEPGSFAGGRVQLQPELAERAFEQLDSVFSFEERVRNAYEMGLQNVAEGISNIAIKYGLDPRDFTLMAYGAAGPMLLPAVMDLVHVEQVVVPPYPGLFSALGLLSADLVFADNRSAYTMFTPDAADGVDEVYTTMEDALREQLPASAGGDVAFVRSFDGRLFGQSWETPFVPAPAGRITADAVNEMIASFHDAYEGRAGHRLEAIPVQGVTYRVHATVPISKVDYPALDHRSGDALGPGTTATLSHLGDDETRAAVYERASLRARDRFDGPAIVREPTATTHVRSGQVAEVGARGELIVRRA